MTCIHISNTVKLFIEVPHPVAFPAYAALCGSAYAALSGNWYCSKYGGPAQAQGRAAQGRPVRGPGLGPAAAWYFVYILGILDISWIYLGIYFGILSGIFLG